MTSKHSSTTTSSSYNLLSIPYYDESLFAKIHEAPTFLPQHENEESIRGILYVTAVITVLHYLILLLMIKTNYQRDGSKATASSDETKEKEKQSLAAWKASYQSTNLLVNLTLGCLGIYYELSSQHTDRSITNKIIGYPTIRYFAIIQIGYQLWALPVGILKVGETPSMIVHHLAVMCVAGVSAFLSCGFRYFTPFFYGVIEISSVPLSVMNAFKHNPRWIERYPSVYSNVRLLFGVTFLIVRVVLWTPFYWDFITLAMMLLRSSEAGSTKVILALFNLSSIVLTMLQYFWASKIVSAMVKGGPKKNAKKGD
ncbi:hypothetical protein HJC23_010722 [Cyclotella cryptica]|uniref:TLC domain-containing protein n=1 Tax=Cyclotella cryptica TaxID=29204 RepID=A0ABD3PDM8_9STRA|eukprot:CCRYP_015457-RA/>CCRYP_015457-RA protein AED:0.07 eAED:0.07 QI:0/-1/0/1/-1/1/1/0/311